jgi:hypothetical protein
LRQITSQFIQDIFLFSSPPPKKRTKNRFKGSNDACWSLEEGKEVDWEREQKNF